MSEVGKRLARTIIGSVFVFGLATIVVDRLIDDENTSYYLIPLVLLAVVIGGSAIYLIASALSPIDPAKVTNAPVVGYRPLPKWADSVLTNIGYLFVTLLAIYGLVYVATELRLGEEERAESIRSGLAGPSGPCSRRRIISAAATSAPASPPMNVPLPTAPQPEPVLREQPEKVFFGKAGKKQMLNFGHFNAGATFKVSPPGKVLYRIKPAAAWQNQLPWEKISGDTLTLSQTGTLQVAPACMRESRCRPIKIKFERQ